MSQNQVQIRTPYYVDIEYGHVVGYTTLQKIPKTKALYIIWNDKGEKHTTWDFDITKHDCRRVGRVGSRDRFVCYD